MGAGAISGWDLAGKRDAADLELVHREAEVALVYAWKLLQKEAC